MQSLAFIALILLAFAGLFAGMQLWSAHAFGWSSLARAYRFSGPFRGQVWRLKQCRLVRMRWAGFEGGLNAFFPSLPRDLPDEVFGTENLELDIGGNAEGLYLAVPSRLQFWHPSLFIPWSDVAVSAEKIHWISYLTPHRRIVITWRGARVEGGWIDCLVFRFRRAPGVLLQLNEEETRPLIATAGSSWPGVVQSQSISTPP
jgi:hypothetical protein